MSESKKKFEWLPTCTRDDNGSIFSFYVQGHLGAREFFEQLSKFDEFQDWLVNSSMTKNEFEAYLVGEVLHHIFLLRGMHGSNYGPPGADFGWSAEESHVSKQGHTPVTKWDVGC